MPQSASTIVNIARQMCLDHWKQIEQNLSSTSRSGDVETHLRRLVGDDLLSPLHAEMIRNIMKQLEEDPNTQQIDQAIDDAFETTALGTLATDEFATEKESLLPRERGDGLAETEDAPGQQDPYATQAPSESTSTTASSGSGKPGLRFRVTRFHAEGGLGKVSRATDIDFNRNVAVKEIRDEHADSISKQRQFIFEAETTGRLEHPGIVPVYALGRYPNGRPYYAMRFIEGDSLKDAIRQLHRDSKDDYAMRQRSLLNRFISVCTTLEYAHQQQIIHRDIKPANIMLGEYGENLVVDWGLAYQLVDPTEATERGAPPIDKNLLVVGTPPYMSPEQASGSPDIDTRADVYSLGATLYHLLSGRSPFHELPRDPQKIIAAVAKGKRPKPLDDSVPKPLRAICAAAMAPDLSERYSSARRLAEDVENFLADQRVSVLEESLLTRLGRWSRRNRSWTLAGAAAIVLVAIVATVASVITLNALSRANLTNSILTQEQAFDRLVAQEKERQRTEIQQQKAVRIDRGTADGLMDLIESIESLQIELGDPAVDQIRRDSLLELWADPIEVLLTRGMTKNAEDEVHSQIDELSDRYRWDSQSLEQVLERLNNQLRVRLEEVRPLPLAAPPEDVFAVTDSKWKREEVDDPEFWPVLLGDCPRGDIHVSMEVDPSTLQSTAIGLVLNATESDSYHFILTNDSYDPVYSVEDPISLGQADDDGRLRMMIVRKSFAYGDMVLRAEPIALDRDDPNQPYRISAHREGGYQLSFYINNQRIQFEDPYPLPPGSPGKYGVYCSTGALFSTPIAKYRVHATGENLKDDAISRGDAFYALENIDLAIQEYKQVDTAEAKFKLALLIDSEAEQQQLFQDIIDNHHPTSETDPAFRWYLYAAVRWISLLSENEESLATLSSLYDRVADVASHEQIQNLIPVTDRPNVFRYMLKSGQRFRLAYDNRGDAKALRQAIELFSDNAEMRQLATWRWCDAIRCDVTLSAQAGRAQAMPVMMGLIKEVEQASDPDEMLHAGLIADYVWMMIVEKQFSEAIEMLDGYLTGSQGKLTYQPLRIERARVYYHQGRFEDAIKDLEAFIAVVTPQSPQYGIHYSHYSQACALLGLIHDEAGRSDLAQQTWRKGRQRNWHIPLVDPSSIAQLRGVGMVLQDSNFEVALTGWTDGYTRAEALNAMEIAMAGSGVADQAFANIILHSDRIPREWVHIVAESMAKYKRGREHAREKLLRTDTMRRHYTEDLIIMLYQAVLHITYDGDETLNKYSDFDRLLYDQATKLLAAYQNDLLSNEDMQFILKGWSGEWNANAFEKLAQRIGTKEVNGQQVIDHELISGMASVFAAMRVKYGGNLESARKILQQYVTEVEDIPETYRRIADEILKAESPGT